MCFFPLGNCLQPHPPSHSCTNARISFWSHTPSRSVIAILSTAIFYLLPSVCFSNLTISFSSSHNLQYPSLQTFLISQGLNPTIFQPSVQSCPLVIWYHQHFFFCLLLVSCPLLLTCFVTFVPLSSPFTLWRLIRGLNQKPLNPEVMLNPQSYRISCLYETSYKHSHNLTTERQGLSC